MSELENKQRPRAHSDHDMVTCLRLPDSDVSAAFQQLCAADMINLFIFPPDQGAHWSGGLILASDWSVMTLPGL